MYAKIYFIRTILTVVLSLFIATSTYAEPQQTIGIVTYSVQGMPPWDPDSINSGITGSEEAVIYVSQKLAKLGYQVIVLGNPPQGSLHSTSEANPRFVDFHDNSTFDIAISWRDPTNGNELRKRASHVLFWPHDTSGYQLSEDQINSFDDVLWLSEWQREQWISVNPGFAKFTHIFGNGINPEQFKPVQERTNPYSCIYGSNYSRGLEILLDIWPTVRQKFPKATLDIYYGWQHWGLLTPQQEMKMRWQVALLKQLGVTEHGLVSHEELNRAYEQASLWTYPCILPETFCITGIRAQLAGATPVIIEGTALEETVRNGLKCSKPEEYLNTLLKAMQEADKITLDERKKYGEFILNEFTWESIAKKWKETFDNLPKRKTIYFVQGHWGNFFDPNNLQHMRQAGYNIEPMIQLKKVALNAGYDLRIADRDSMTLTDVTGTPVKEFEYIIVFDVFPHQFEYLRNYPKEKLVLFLWEPPSVMAQNYDPNNHQYFSKVYTWKDDLVDNSQYHKIFYPVLLPMESQLIDFNNKKLCTLIASHRTSTHSNELYSERGNVVDFYEKKHPNDFTVYGRGWPHWYKTYGGTIQSKVDVLKRYKFCYSYENIKDEPGYITEKIFDCFHAGCVPIYLGASNISKYVPKECFISRKDFGSNEELYQFIKNMPEDVYLDYLKNIKRFLASHEAQLYSFNNFVNILMNLITTPVR